MEKTFNKILEDIKSIKIQGAENIAKYGIKAFLLNPTKDSAKKILTTRPTEPLMQNAIKLLLKSKNPKKTAEKFLKDLRKSHEKLVKKGSTLIKKNMNIYTHCHSSSVIDILKYAKIKRKKDFVVYTTEVEPLLQGRKTAEDLSKAGIKVIISPDMAFEQIIKKCNIFLFGADAFTKKFVVNKIGTSIIVDIAKHYNIPRYACGVSTKFAKKIKLEYRPAKEVWDIRKNKKIQIINPAFDKTPLKFLTGIVSEFGVLKPKEFLKRVRASLRK